MEKSSATNVSERRGGRAGRTTSQARSLVIAHRGYSAIAPENTLPSFEFALQTGADLIELDYYHSRDDLPVVFHDSTLDRTTDARALWKEKGSTVRDKTWEELRRLDAGAWFHSRYAGVGLLRLEEALEKIQAGGVTLIERKSGDADSLVAILRSRRLLSDVVVQSFDWEFIRACHELEPGLMLGALGPPGSHRKGEGEDGWLDSPFLDRIVEAGAKIVGWNDRVTREAISEAHSRGLRVWVYVVNDLERAHHLLDLGVDGLITDNPGLIWKALAVREPARPGGDV